MGVKLQKAVSSPQFWHLIKHFAMYSPFKEKALHMHELECYVYMILKYPAGYSTQCLLILVPSVSGYIRQGKNELWGQDEKF